MARLFITAKEIQLINHWTAEFIKDVNGQKVYYFPVSAIKTKVHSVYNESQKKIFDNPIEIDAIVGQPEWSAVQTQFGVEQTATLEVHIQYRDLLDKGITIVEGDFIKYGGFFYEINSFVNSNNIFGHEDYDVGYKLMAKLARAVQFSGPNATGYAPEEQGVDFKTSAEQKVFEQTRGLPENSFGQTGDKRQVLERLKDEMPEIALGEGPRRVDDTNIVPDGIPADKDQTTSVNNDTPNVVTTKRSIYG